jgi:hypothetical protein
MSHFGYLSKNDEKICTYIDETNQSQSKTETHTRYRLIYSTLYCTLYSIVNHPDIVGHLTDSISMIFDFSALI